MPPQILEFSDINPCSRLRGLRKLLYEWVDEKDDLVKELDALASDLDDHFNRISKAKVGGSAAAVGGGILAAIGFGLSFVTFGASLGLSIAGGVIAGAGGATVSGSIITDAVLSKKRKTSAEVILQKYKSRVEQLKLECVEIGTLLKNHGKIEQDFPFWICFWAKLIIGTGSAAKNVGWDLITRTILNSIRIVTYVDDVALAGARAGATAFRTLGAAGRGLHIAGGVFGILLLPLDIYTLVDSSLDVHKRNPHKVSEAIRQTAAKISEECPTREDIEEMIGETLRYFD